MNIEIKMEKRSQQYFQNTQKKCKNRKKSQNTYEFMLLTKAKMNPEMFLKKEEKGRQQRSQNSKKHKYKKKHKILTNPKFKAETKLKMYLKKRRKWNASSVPRIKKKYKTQKKKQNTYELGFRFPKSKAKINPEYSQKRNQKCT